jgi:pentatricopeptide repeat protein
MTATSITILLLRSSTSPSEAFQAYKRIFKRPDGKPTLDAEGYVAVLNAFCRLTFRKANIHTALPPWEQYFEIVKDMREAGYPVNVKVYTIILQQLGLAATKFRQARNIDEDSEQPDLYELERAIRKIHQLITMDASIQPDTIAWNTLMDAYQRAGCVRDAYRVWDTLWVTRTFDNASVSIIADACGHANAFNEALQIFSRLHASGFTLNLRNWNAWLECLCRLGRLDEAVKTACLEMGKNDNAEPDEKSIAIILRFAASTRDEHQIRERIKRYLPELWNSLPKELTL